MSDNDTPVTPRQKLGIGIFVIGVGCLTDVYWRTGGSLPGVGHVSVWLFALVTAAIGAGSFWLLGQKPETRRIGLLTGALAGFGCSLAFHFVYGGVNRAGPERVFVSLIGMAPGLFIGHLLVKRVEAKAKLPTNNG